MGRPVVGGEIVVVGKSELPANLGAGGRAGRRIGSLLAMVGAALVVLGLMVVGCSGKTTQAGGLVLLVETDMKAGTDFDSITVQIGQETGQDGGYRTLVDVPITVEANTLPATISITAGSSPEQEALIAITATKGNPAVAVVERTIEVQVPRDRVAELVVLLASDCAGKLSCPVSESCNPDTGGCATDVVDASTLPSYSPGGSGAGGRWTRPSGTAPWPTRRCRRARRIRRRPRRHRRRPAWRMS